MPADPSSADGAAAASPPRRRASQHSLQFYGDDGRLCATVGGFVGAGLASGERALVIATEPHWNAVAGHLGRNMFDVDRARNSGRLAFVDAAVLLSKVMVDGAPDRRAFEAAIGSRLREDSREGGATPVRVYGEMMDLLWRDARPQAAVDLEAMWSDLVDRRAMSLLSAYHVADRDWRVRRSALVEMCGTSSHVLAGGGAGAGGRGVDFGELSQRASLAIDRARAREAREANRAKDDFLATMSHELRTPLNAILGWATMLRTRPEVDVHKAIGAIERNARTQVRLIESVLDLSRIVTGKLRLYPKAIDLAEAVRASIELVAPTAAAKGIVIEADLGGGPCPLHGDPVRLQQVAMHLVSNAVKFTPRGGRVAVRLARACSPDRVALVVEDSGKGIHADFLPTMFQRFRQADSSTTRTEGGLGIGLALVRHLVELHGGTVQASSPGEGLGATFTITLPVRAVRADEIGPRTKPRAIAAPRSLSGVRVLVCEDDADSRDLLQEVLSGEGATVIVASAAPEALDRLRASRPDVLVSDIGLPIVDGYSLMRQVRHLSADEGGRTPAIALTAFASADDARKALLAGYQHHVAKPVDPAELAASVASLAGRTAHASSLRPKHDSQPPPL